MTAELRRGLFLGILGLLVGLGLVAALFGGGAYLKRLAAVQPPATLAPSPPVGALSPEGAGRGDPAPGGTPEPGRQAGPAPTTTDAPTFDVVRVEPNGESVVAGRGAPNTVVELLVDGKPVARALADPNGQFAIVPPALPAGSSEIVLRATGADGRETRSRDSVAVAVSRTRDAKPLVALTSPDRPTVVLSQPDPTVAKAPAPPGRQAAIGERARGQDVQAKDGPGRDPQGRDQRGRDRQGATGQDGESRGRQRPGRDAAGKDGGGKDGGSKDGGGGNASGTKPAPGAPPAEAKVAPVKIVSVDAQEGGRLFVTGQAAPGATVRLYLNETLIAPASVGGDGKVTFTIGRGVKPGAYTVRVDQVDPVSGKVRSRAEVPFSVPEPARVAAAARPSVGPAPREAAAQKPAAPREAAVPSKPAASPAPEPAQRGAARPEAVPAVPPPGAPMPAALDPPGPAAPAPGSVFVPEIATARIIRGDSLWEISRRTYGSGDRYTVIYDANQEQIRNPDLIYPGQIFVLPGDRDGRRG